MDRLKETISTFDKYADQYHEKFTEYEPYIETYRFLSGLIKPDADVLDTACGPGNISRYLLNEKPHLKIHGIDLSVQMIELAKRNLPAATFSVMDSRKLHALEKSYDVIIAGFLFPYLSKQDVSEFIQHAREIIRTNGVFYISTMEGDYEQSGYQDSDNPDRIYMYYYQESFLTQQLLAFGFDVITTDRQVFALDKSQQTTDLFIYARAI